MTFALLPGHRPCLIESIQPRAQRLVFLVFVTWSQFVYGPEVSPYEFPSMANLVADVQAWIDDPNTNG
jgi:hypothetical protein